MAGAKLNPWSSVGVDASDRTENCVDVSNRDRLYELHPSDTPGTSLIGFQLSGCENYHIWSKAMIDSLLVKNKLCFVNGTCVRDSVHEHLQFRWDSCNVIVKG